MKLILCVILLVSVAFIGTVSWASDAGASNYQLADNFESYKTGAWAEGSTHGPWYVQFNGYGSVGIGGTRAGKYFYEKPKASTTPSQTHASLATSTMSFDGIDMTMQQKTVKQLRTGSRPNPWEVGWTVWGYSDNLHFYYFILKPEGIELGKENPDYPGAQRYLYTSTSPKLTIGKWNTIRVQQVNATINVWVNGVQVINGFVDSPGPAGDQPYTNGKIGMYSEDAYAYFDNVVAQSTGAAPSTSGGKASSTSILPSNLGGDQNARSNAPQVGPSNIQQQSTPTPGAPGAPSQSQNVPDLELPANPSPQPE